MTALFPVHSRPESSTSQNKLWAEHTPYILLLNFLFFKPLQMTKSSQPETLEKELDRVGKKKPETQREREKKGEKRSHWDKHLLWSFPLLSSCLLETKQLHKSISCVFSQHVYYVYNQGHFAGDSSTLFQALVHFLFFPFVFYLLLFFLNKQHQAPLFLASADKKLKPSQLI